MTVSIWVAILPVAVTIIIGILTYLHNKKVLRETKRQNRATIEEARLSKQEEFIERSLNEFYYPTQGYLQVSKSLFRILTADKPKEFRLLSHLLDPKQLYEIEGMKGRVDLSESDNQVIAEIIEIEKKLEKIFVNKIGLVDDLSLLSKYEPNVDITDIKLDVKDIGLISLAVAHFHVLRLAFEGKLTGNTSVYQQFVFPRELPIKIAENLDKLRNLSGTLVNPFLSEDETITDLLEG